MSRRRHEDVCVEDNSHELLRPALAPYGLNLGDRHFHSFLFT